MLSIQQNDMNIVLTAGTDMRIRYWNLSSPQESYIVAGGSNELINPALVSYKYWLSQTFFSFKMVLKISNE